MRILRLWNETGTMIWRFLLFTYIIFYWNLVAITETLVCITEISNICGAPITITVSAMDVCWQGNESHFIFVTLFHLNGVFPLHQYGVLCSNARQYQKRIGIFHVREYRLVKWWKRMPNIPWNSCESKLIFRGFSRVCGGFCFSARRLNICTKR